LFRLWVSRHNSKRLAMLQKIVNRLSKQPSNSLTNLFLSSVFRASTATHADEVPVSVTLSPESKYFLRCPLSSHHAQYSWRHLGSSTRCSWRAQQCLLLIDSMGPEQAGAYTCESEEMGHRRVLAQYRLQLEGRAAGPSSSRLIWLCLLAVLVKSLS